MELTLWDHISNLPWAQKLLVWRLHLWNSTTDWKNKGSLGPGMMEKWLRECCQILLILVNAKKKTPKPPWERSQIFFRIFTRKKISKKTLLEVRTWHRALRGWQTGPLLAVLISNTFESGISFFESWSKITWKIKKKKFWPEKFPEMKILKTFENHVNRYPAPLSSLWSRFLPISLFLRCI